MVCFDKFFYFFFFFYTYFNPYQTDSGPVSDRIKKKKKMVIDAHATVSMAAQRVRVHGSTASPCILDSVVPTQSAHPCFPARW